ncbi:helix-turn-helix transcriptional regulator [Thermorudis peleae]|uniref:helix-turn-helix transcriptional regulator n=1 Tax=Thermorudis peleae TaxID=1382356 RepID=UPI00068F2DE6|nr:helix-turn-helix transcriptional regulator [Thermorudis peleae]
MTTEPERRLEPATAVLARALTDTAVRQRWQATALARAFALWLVRRRAELGLSQTELARRLGVSQPTVARWESGEHVPEIATLVRLAETLGLHVALEIVPAHPGEGTAVVEEDAETPQGARLHALLAVR